MFKSEVLLVRPFRNLWLGQCVSQLGDAFYYVVFAFMVLRVTGSNAMVGMVGAAETAPYLLLSPYAGVLADRLDRRRIMLVSDLLCSAILLAFAGLIYATGKPPVVGIFAAGILLASARCFYMPAKSASIPALVPEALVMKANSLSMTTMNLTQIVGLAISAAVLAALYAISVKWFFLLAVLLNATSFLGSAYFIAKLPPVIPDRDHANRPHAAQDLVAGFRYIGSRHVLKVLLSLSFFMTLFIAPFFVVYLAANKAWFGNLPSTVAWCEFFFFLGMVVSSYAVGRLNVRKVGQGFIWGLAACGAGVAMMAFSRHIWLFCIWNFICGLAVPFAQIPIATYIQTSVPDEFRGRVNSAMTIVTMGVQPIGLVFGGLLVDSVGLVNGFLIMGAGMGAAALAGLLDRDFRNAETPIPAQPSEGEADDPALSPAAETALPKVESSLGPR